MKAENAEINAADRFESKLAKAEKPFTKPGHSGPTPKAIAWAEEVLDKSAKSKRDGKKAIGQERVLEHKQALEDKEALRLAQLEEQCENRRKADAIMYGH